MQLPSANFAELVSNLSPYFVKRGETIDTLQIDKSVIAGDGLTGGGVLTSDVTLNVATTATGGITINANSIEAKIKSSGGLASDASGLYAELAASGGLQYSSGIKIALQTDSGLALAAGGLAVAGPQDVTGSSTSTVSGATHSHALDISAVDFSALAGDGLLWNTDRIDVDLSTNSGLQLTAADGSGELEMGTPTAVDMSSTDAVTTTTHSHSLDISGIDGDGLIWDSAELDIDLSTNSGLQLTAAELEMGTPSDVNASSTNSVTTTTHTHVLDISAVDFSALAGDGLLWNTDRIDIDLSTNSGLQLTAADGSGELEMGTPTTIDLTTTDSVTTSTHAHNITTSSAPSDAQILQSDASGYLQLVRLGLGVSPSYSLHIQATDAEQFRLAYDSDDYASFSTASDGDLTISTVTSGSGGLLTLSPVGDIILDPTGNDVLPGTTNDISLGSIPKRYLSLHAAELMVQTIVAQDVIATIGGRVLIGVTSYLTSDVDGDTPGPEDTTIDVEHNDFAINDVLYMETSGQVEWMLVTAGPSGGGPYTYTVTRDYESSGTSHDWVIGDAVFNTGTTAGGEGFIDLFSVQGIHGSGSGPTIIGNVRTGSAYNAYSEHWAIGNLDGVYGYSSATYGVALGRYDASYNHITIDDTDGIRFFDGTSTVMMQFQADGDIFIGSDISSPSLAYFSIFTNAQTYNSESVEAGDMLIGDNSASKANIFWDKSSATLNFRGGTDTQAWIATDGSITAGGGDVIVDETGISIRESLDFLRFLQYSTVEADYMPSGYVGLLAPRTSYDFSTLRIYKGDEGDELSLNGDFESDITGWTDVGAGTGYDSIAQSSEQAKYGTYSAKLSIACDVTNRGDWQTSSYITISTGGSAKFSGWIYMSSAGSAGDPSVAIRWYEEIGDVFLQEDTATIYGTTGKWHYFEVLSKGPSGGNKVKLDIRAGANGSGTWTFYVDGLSLREIVSGGYALIDLLAQNSNTLSEVHLVGEVVRVISADSAESTPTHTFVVGDGSDDTPAELHVHGSATGVGKTEDGMYLSFTPDYTKLWGLVSNDDTMSGSNAGANFDFNRYADNGGLLGAVFSVQRSTGYVDFENRVGIGVGTWPSYPLHILSNDASQVRIAYDGTNYADFQVSSSGVLTIVTAPTGNRIDLSAYAGDNISWDAVDFQFDAAAGNDPDFTEQITITTTSTPQLQLLYNGSNYVDFSVSSGGAFTIESSGNSTAINDQVTITTTSTPQLKLVHTATVDYADFSVDSNGHLTIAPSNDILFAPSGGDTYVSSGQFGVGGIPAHPIHVTSTAAYQVSIDYDASNYCEIGVSASGTLKFNASGNAIVFDGKMAVGAISTANYPLQIRNTSTPQFRLEYDGTNYTNFTVSSAGDLTITPYGDDVFIEGALWINETVNTFSTEGLTINQLATDDEIISLKSSDVGHSFTGVTELDTYGVMKKFGATYGGLSIYGITDDTTDFTGLALRGWGDGNADTDKTTSATGAVLIDGATDDGAAYSTTLGINENILVVRNSTTAKFIVDAEGEIHADASTGSGTMGTFDFHDDIALLKGLRASLLPAEHELRRRFSIFIEEARPILEAAGVVTYNDDGHHFVAIQKMQMLTIDAVRQFYDRQTIINESVHSRLASAESKLARYGQALLAAGIDPATLED